MTLRCAAAFLTGGLLGFGLPAGARQETAAPPVQFEAAIDVSLTTVVVRVVDTWGQPVPDLTPRDFRVRAGKLEVPVVAVDWTSGDDPPPAAAPVPPAPFADAAPVTEALPHPPGRLMVFFVQADLNPPSISGQLRLRPHTRELLETLHPEDRIAVVSYDSHLKLRQNFTRDHASAYAALDEAMLWGPEREIAPAGPDSLAGHFDFAAAREAASPE